MWEVDELMLPTMVQRLLLFGVACTLLLAAAGRSQVTTSVLPTVSPEEYGKWETLACRPVLSPDGRWLA